MPRAESLSHRCHSGASRGNQRLVVRSTDPLGYASPEPLIKAAVFVFDQPEPQLGVLTGQVG